MCGAAVTTNHHGGPFLSLAFIFMTKCGADIIDTEMSAAVSVYPVKSVAPPTYLRYRLPHEILYPF